MGAGDGDVASYSRTQWGCSQRGAVESGGGRAPCRCFEKVSRLHLRRLNLLSTVWKAKAAVAGLQGTAGAQQDLYRAAERASGWLGGSGGR
jgi:hypothetical protein